MSVWVRRLRIKNEWSKADAGDIEVKELADIIANKLTAFGIPGDVELEEIIEDFKALEEDASFDDFNEIMDRLYNWADISLDNVFGGKKNCWIETF
jgi:hypothetical protein